MSQEHFIQVSQLVKSYGDQAPVLKGIDFELDQGQVAVVIGPSGCGKSTFLRCLNALESIDSGQILINGTEIFKEVDDLPKIREKVGMVFQSYDLFPHLNVLQNLTLAPRKVQGRPEKECDQEAQDLLAKVGLEDKLLAYPRELSGGQKQRVAIVRALMMQPEVLLLDEVTASLDPEVVHEVLDVVLSLAKEGLTMVIVTHEMDFARAVADKLYFLDRGQVVEVSDNPRDFFNQPQTERAQTFIQSLQYEGV